MKKVLISTVAVASVFILSSCKVPFQKDDKGVMPAENAMMKDGPSMMEQAPGTTMPTPDSSNAMMKNDGMMKNDTMMKADVKAQAGTMMQK